LSRRLRAATVADMPEPRAYEIAAQLLTRRLVIDLGYVVASRCPRH
jgi:hypothetical protein